VEKGSADIYKIYRYIFVGFQVYISRSSQLLHRFFIVATQPLCSWFVLVVTGLVSDLISVINWPVSLSVSRGKIVFKSLTVSPFRHCKW